MDASSLTSRVTIYPMWSVGHFTINAPGNLTALNVNFAGVMRKSSATISGGSISNTGGAVRLVDCLLYNNTVMAGYGQGAAISSSAGTLSLQSCACHFSSGPTRSRTRPLLQAKLIARHVTTGVFDSNYLSGTGYAYGAALYITSATTDILIKGCTFQRNQVGCLCPKPPILFYAASSPQPL